jgi:hypothetical protein
MMADNSKQQYWCVQCVQRLECRIVLWRSFYNADWLKRAAAAKGGIFGNSAVEAMYQ